MGKFQWYLAESANLPNKIRATGEIWTLREKYLYFFRVLSEMDTPFIYI